MKRKILHVFECFAQGGIENLVMNIFRNIDHEKYEFHFAFINRTPGVFDEEVIKNGGYIWYFIDDKKTLKNYKNSLTKIISEHGPFDVLHSHMYYFSGYILKIGKKAGVPIRIAHSHETYKGQSHGLKRRIYEKYMLFLMKKNATHLLSCSKDAGDYTFKGLKYTVLYNGIDMDRFSYDANKRKQIRDKYNIGDDEVVFLNVGRFADQKNHSFLIDIFEEYQKENEMARLILIGEGALEDKIRAKVVVKGIENKVIFAGTSTHCEDYYDACDCFVMPSKYEGLGIVAIEAQASGAPIVASTMVPNEIKILDLVEFVDLEDSAAKWCSVIKRVLKEGNDRTLANNIMCKSHFSICKTVELLSNIYDGKGIN